MGLICFNHKDIIAKVGQLLREHHGLSDCSIEDVEIVGNFVYFTTVRDKAHPVRQEWELRLLRK